MAGWPFWAATSDERIDQALELARLGPREHLVDLGCGDGRVLLRAAAFYGARVTGVELDGELAARARSLLADHDVDGSVVEADFAEVALDDADVVFAYLSPATLQRLLPRLAALAAGTRIVTTGYAIPGWQPDEAAGRCFLYRLPPTEDAEVDPTRRGWHSAGVLVALHPDSPSLVGVKLHHGGGPIIVSIAEASTPGLAVRAGADDAAAGAEVVVDLRFDRQPPGSIMTATLTEASSGAFRIVAVVDEGEPGIWGMAEAGCEAVVAAVRRGEAGWVLEGARRSGRRIDP